MTPRNRSTRASPETAVAAAVVAWLRSPQRGGVWEVYQEVEAPGGRCDIVAVRDGTVWAIEVKVSLSLALLEQAVHWLPYAHQVSLVASFRRSKAAYQHRELLARLGLGLLAVPTPSSSYQYGVYEPIKPTAQPADLVGMMLQQLRPQQRTNTAGSQGGFWTPYKESCTTLLQYVVQHPGCSLKQAITDLGKLHYSSPGSARSALTKRLRQRVVPGIWQDRTGTLWHAPLGALPDLALLTRLV